MKRREEPGIRILLLHDEAPAQISQAAVAAASAGGLNLLSHSPYDPELVPTYFHLFPIHNLVLQGRQFYSDDDGGVEALLNHQDDKFLLDGIIK